MSRKWKKLWAAAPKNDISGRICISDYKMAYDEENDTWYPCIGRISNIFGLSFEDGLLMIDANWDSYDEV